MSRPDRPRRRGTLELGGSVVSGVLRGLGVEEEIRRHQAFVLWDEVVGRPTRDHARPLAIHRDVLHVEVDTAGWMHELSYLTEELRQELNRRIGREALTEIRLQLGGTTRGVPEPPPPPPPRPELERRPPPPPDARERAAASALVAEVENPALREQLARLCARALADERSKGGPRR